MPYMDIKSISSDIKKLNIKKKKIQSKLSRLKSNAKASAKQRVKIKMLKEKYMDKFPNGNGMVFRKKAGRPPVEVYAPGLGGVMQDIVNVSCAADPKRRSEIVTTANTLDDLQQQLFDRGFILKRSTLYLRVLPRRGNTNEGKRHVHTLPIKLLKPQEDDHGKNISTRFCLVEDRMMKEITSYLGPEQAVYAGMDDKAKVPLGITAANKQQAILMRVEYKVRLTDLSFAVADRHELKVSVIAFHDIQPNKFGNPSAVSYKGETFIRVRSGKHDTSTIWDHGIDLREAMQTETFKHRLWNASGVKPCWFIRTDGGIDQNVRVQGTITMYYNIFIDYNLDILVVTNSAAGSSAYNTVERRMAPISKKLCGIALDHQSLGSHLDSNNKTVDVELEKRNFAAAGNILSEIFSEGLIDGYICDCKYVPPISKQEKINKFQDYNEEWMDKHVTHGYHSLIYMKCNDNTCCRPFRSNILDILPKKKYPAAVYFQHDRGTIKLGKQYKDPPDGIHFARYHDIVTLAPLLYHDGYRDAYDPAFDQDTLKSTSCRVCGKYFPTKKLMKAHRKVLHPRSRDDNLDDFKADYDDSDDLLTEIEIRFYNNIKKVLHYRMGQYLVEMNNGRRCWIVLSDDHEKVKEYLDGLDDDDDDIQVEREAMPTINNLLQWNQCPWIPDESYTENVDL